MKQKALAISANEYVHTHVRVGRKKFKSYKEEVLPITNVHHTPASVFDPSVNIARYMFTVS